jgi:hypothetical protein
MMRSPRASSVIWRRSVPSYFCRCFAAVISPNTSNRRPVGLSCHWRPMSVKLCSAPSCWRDQACSIPHRRPSKISPLSGSIPASRSQQIPADNWPDHSPREGQSTIRQGIISAAVLPRQTHSHLLECEERNHETTLCSCMCAAGWRVASDFSGRPRLRGGGTQPRQHGASSSFRASQLCLKPQRPCPRDFAAGTGSG